MLKLCEVACHVRCVCVCVCSSYLTLISMFHVSSVPGGVSGAGGRGAHLQAGPRGGAAANEAGAAAVPRLHPGPAAALAGQIHTNTPLHTH